MLTWSEIATLTESGFRFGNDGIVIWDRHRLTLASSVGEKKIVITGGFERHDEIWYTIFSQVGAVLLPRMLDAIARGEGVLFGRKEDNFRVMSDGLCWQEERRTWDAVGSFVITDGAVEDGVLSVLDSSGREWFHVSIWAMPNWYFFPILVSRLRQRPAVAREVVPAASVAAP
jgi:hypothetical protein